MTISSRALSKYGCWKDQQPVEAEVCSEGEAGYSRIIEHYETRS